jgi:hypothetical protein
MSQISDSFASQISDLATKFKNSCGAGAFFYYNDNNDHGMRVEATSIMKEFVDKVDFGRGKP